MSAKSALVFAAAMCALSMACTSAQTSSALVAPSGDKCQVAATTSPSSFGDAGGQGTVSISAARDCTWTVAADVGWISVDGHDGQGESTIKYTVARNGTPAPRRGNVTVSLQQLAIAQDGAPCRFDLDRPGADLAASGGSVAISIATLAGCNWTASSGASWIRVAQGASGNGPGQVTLAIDPNTGAERSARATIAGQPFTITEAAPAPGPGDPTAPGPGPAPGPTPAPAPTPAPPETIMLSGTVSGLSGRCPNIVFELSGRIVAANSDTSYAKKDSCGEVKPGVPVDVTGIAQANGTLLATRIDVKPGD